MKKHLSLVILLALGVTGCTQPVRLGEKPDQPPVADFTLQCADCQGERSGLAPLKILLDASPSTDDHGILLVHWSLGNGREATGPQVETIYEKPGHYEITLTVYDQKGQKATAKTEITVLEPPPPPYRVERAENDLMIVERILPNRTLKVGETVEVRVRVTAKRDIEYVFWRELPAYPLTSPERLEFMILWLPKDMTQEWVYTVTVEDSGRSKLDGDGRAAWRAEAAELTLSTTIEIP
ncbi:MAG: PKD domain-containing protein [Candidatus Bipolaricaulota bacterium]|nr:PKD domain-containing protein [Candidatus Bipolaricaulota bacterium]MDW8140764.1 PKD domain-containing protein [Candidatus Bipolaricaulota bacterium]